MILCLFLCVLFYDNLLFFFFFLKQKTEYEMRISDWSSDVCSSDLFIALVKYEDGTVSYILAPQRLGVGDTIIAGKKTDVKPGNAMELSQMPVGTIVHNIEMKPGKGGQIARSAGTYAQVVGRDRGLVIVRLGSGEQRYVREIGRAHV